DRVIRKAPVGFGDQRVSAQRTVLSDERRDLHVRRTADGAHTLVGEPPMVLIVYQQAALDELPSIGIGGERESAVLVRHEIVRAAGHRLLAIEQEQLLEVTIPY